MTEDRSCKNNFEGKNEKQKPDAPDWLIENIAEASINARKLYFLYIGFLAYCSLTVISTSDRQIILNDTAKLPIVNLDVSLNGFFILAPVIAILVFIYFQLYLHRLKALINDLRTNYAPTKKRRLYPWMINIAEDPEPGAIGALQRIIVGFSLWTSLTLVLVLFAFWYVKKHDPFWSFVIGSLPLVGALTTFWFWMKYEPRKLRKSKWSKVFSLVGFSLLIAFELCLLILLIPWAREGGRIEWLKPLICLNLSYQKLVDEPKTHYVGLFWGNYRKAHLEGADLSNSVLKRANLTNAYLQYAKISSAILDSANLQNANLQNADLRGTSLQNANLYKSNLQNARIDNANFQDANLEYANLQEVSLAMMSLRYGSISSIGVNFREAKLGHAKLTNAQLWGANFQEAFLREANLKGTILNLATLFKANIKGANLQNAQLGEVTVTHDSGKKFNLRVNLQEADLREVDFMGARLTGANFRGADLRDAKNLNVEQLSKVSSLYMAKLNPRLLEKIRKKYPHLLEEPVKDKIDPKILEEINKAYPNVLVEPD